MPVRDYREHLDEVLKDPDATAEYLTAAIADSSLEPNVLAIAIQDIFRSRDKYISSDFYCREVSAAFRLVVMNLDRMGLKFKVEKA